MALFTRGRGDNNNNIGDDRTAARAYISDDGTRFIIANGRFIFSADKRYVLTGEPVEYYRFGRNT